jgi:hypothetical protein
MASAVQTVCGQAYGAKKYAVMCITLQRAVILHLGAAVVLTDKEHSRARPSFCSRSYSSTLCICINLSNAEVSPSTEHC